MNAPLSSDDSSLLFWLLSWLFFLSWLLSWLSFLSWLLYLLFFSDSFINLSNTSSSPYTFKFDFLFIFTFIVSAFISSSIVVSFSFSSCLLVSVSFSVLTPSLSFITSVIILEYGIKFSGFIGFLSAGITISPSCINAICVSGTHEVPCA